MPEARNPNTMSSFADSWPETNTKENRALDFIHHVTSHADEVQAQVLHEILSKNSNTEYLHGHGFNGLTDRESFKKIVPIITYEDVQPYILRIANSDKSPILCSTPISDFRTSSGTSGGERKMMPTIPEELDRKELLYGLLMPVINQCVKDLDKVKAMYFYFVTAESKTPGGLLARPVLTSYYRSKQFQEKPCDPFNACTSPMEAILCTDVAQSMYSQMLCGLAQNREVFRIGAVFASGLLRAIRFLQENWGELCNDLRNGTVSEKRVQDPEVRRGVMRILRADPALAEEIETECSKECWRGILQRLWPNTKYLEVVVTGAMAQYIPTLDFFSGGLPKVRVMYASSQCYFGINLKPMAKPSEVSYTLLPNMGYFEFIPVRRDEEENGSSETEEPVELVDVKVGLEYELIVTTYAGLYRYKVGDILKVTGFHNNAPQFRFVCRKNVALSIDSDKTDEVELHSDKTDEVDNTHQNLPKKDAPKPPSLASGNKHCYLVFPYTCLLDSAEMKKCALFFVVFLVFLVCSTFTAQAKTAKEMGAMALHPSSRRQPWHCIHLQGDTVQAVPASVIGIDKTYLQYLEIQTSGRNMVLLRGQLQGLANLYRSWFQQNNQPYWDPFQESEFSL